MRIVIEEIPQEGLDVAVGPREPWAREAAARALEGSVESLEGHLEVRRLGHGVRVTGRARARVARTCDRCLAEVRLDVGGPVDLWFEGLRADGVSALTADALDVGFLDGGELDLGDVLCEHLSLESPAVVRCADPGVTRVRPGPCALGEVAPGERPAGGAFAALGRLKLDD